MKSLIGQGLKYFKHDRSRKVAMTHTIWERKINWQGTILVIFGRRGRYFGEGGLMVKLTSRFARPGQTGDQGGGGTLSRSPCHMPVL